MAFCTKCGANLPDNARFCGVCGAQLGAPAQQAPVNQYQQPRQPAGYNQYQQPYQQPRQPGYADYGWNAPPRGANRVRNLGLLRFLSVLLALGIIVAAVGFGGWLYVGRTVDSLIDESLKKSKEPYQEIIDNKDSYPSYRVENAEKQLKQMDEVKEKFYEPFKGDIRNFLSAVIAEDPQGLKNTAKGFVTSLLQNPDRLKSAFEMAVSASSSSVSFDFPSSTIKEFYSENKSDINELMDDMLKDIDNSALREPMEKVGQIGSEEFGFRWFMLKIGAKGILITIIGGAVAVLSLLLWLLLGGPSAGAGRTGFAPMLIIALVLAAAIIASCLFLVSTVSVDELNDVVNAESKNYKSWDSATSDLVRQATKAWDKYQEKIIKLFTPLATKLQNEISIPISIPNY